MARSPRITIPTLPHHIVQRGNNHGVGQRSRRHPTGASDRTGGISEAGWGESRKTSRRWNTGTAKKEAARDPRKCTLTPILLTWFGWRS